MTFFQWFYQQRSSTRLGFLLQTVTRILLALAGLFWNRFLLHSMGRQLWGVFSNFQGIALLGGVGDLGMGGMVGIHSNQMLGQGRQEELRRFLAASRALFLILALVVGSIYLALSVEVLPAVLMKNGATDTGSLQRLCLLGAAGASLLVINSYFTNLNYGCGNVVWPVVPAFLLIQLTQLAHWTLARQHAPLWQQYLPYLFSLGLSTLLAWWYVRLSHPPLAQAWPLTWEPRRFAALLKESFWVYLYSLSAGLYVLSDRLMVQWGFGAEEVPMFQNNNKLCELALTVIMSASLVSTPKLTQWLSAGGADLHRARAVARRLVQFQTLTGCAAALVYLGINDVFISHWIGPAFRAPLPLQAAFAVTLAVTAAGYCGYDLTPRCHQRGVRLGGTVVFLGAGLNFLCSYLAMKQGSITGIAWATALAQSLLLLVTGRYAFTQLNLPWRQLTLVSWGLAVGVSLAGYGLRMWLTPDSWGQGLLLVLFYAGLLVLTAVLLGVRPADVSMEWGQVRALLSKKGRHS